MMNKYLNWILIFSSLLPTISAAKVNQELSEKDSLEQYYHSLFLGEKRTSLYYGPLDPRSSFNRESGELWLLDDQFLTHYFDEHLQPEALDFHDFWVKKIIDKSNCPDIVLGENIDYIRYLYRLLSISYLFESLKIHHKVAREFGASKNICSLSYDDVFKKCRPQSDDMKKFQERVFGKFVNEISKAQINSFSKKEMSDWMQNFQHSTSLSLDPIHTRLHDWCYEKKMNCRSLSIDELKEALGSLCYEDTELIQNLCSETDSLYGASYLDKASELIQSSNAFNVINHRSMGEDCLRRYVKIFTPKEIRYSHLSKQFPLIYSHLRKSNSRYLQGDLFLPGALKEFDVKGLSDFLVALKPPRPEVKLVKTPKIKVKQAPPAKAEVVKKVIAAPTPEPVKMEIVEVEKPKISEFEKCLEEIQLHKLEQLFLNMDNFRDDFEFTSQMVADLSVPIKKFQTRQALNDMKAYDNLGSAEAPVGLIFLKYLIDTENHQGLYNLINVLGSKFYVNNDIEKKMKPVFIELRNDSSTKNHWQIILLSKK